MDYKYYTVSKEEKLSSIAAKLDSTPHEIKAHNPELRTFSGLLGGEFVSVGQRIKIPIVQPVQVSEDKKIQAESEIPINLEFGAPVRYRCEQVVINKLNDIIANHSETKREFVVRKAVMNGRIFFEVNMVDNIIKCSPQQMQESLTLISEVDTIKCNPLAEVNSGTGKIIKVHNYAQILQNWENYKKELKNRFSFSSKGKESQALEEFIQGSESLMIPEKNFIQDLETKLFFDLFFRSYLVNSEPIQELPPQVFYSSFFDRIEVPLNFRQDVIKEDENIAEVRKVSTMNEKDLPLEKIEKLYDERFKPMVGYKFSEFNYSYRERFILNKEKNLIEESKVTIIEEVKNNIQLLIDYKLNQIE